MPKLIVVDGSNIATEGRSEPSLAQLHDAVMALMEEYKGAKVSVIVDATFGHRISKKERAEFDKAIANNELVAPPAGAVGRGDAFILAIADKSGASIFSNDSFQEFHGKYKWLFDDGRLIGGKAVPHVGWVFVERLPVRGPTSRRSVKSGTVVPKELPKASPEASKPMPVPKSPPPGARKSARPAARANTPAPAPTKTTAMANDVMPYLSFVEKHPVGTKVKAVVDTYAANGITVKIGDISGYVSLRNMATPPPRSARDLFKLGDTVALMVSGYTPSRRSVDLGVPEVVSTNLKTVEKKAPAAKTAKKATPAKSTVKKTVSKAVAKPASKAVVVKATPTKAVAKKAVATKAVAKKATPTKAVAKKAAVKKAAPAKSVAKKTTAAKKPATKK
ncbi:MAG: hypothetical protein RLZ18_1344 [Actinomycetota bacterium]